MFIVKDKNWFKFIKNPEIYLKRKVKKFKKINFLVK